VQAAPFASQARPKAVEGFTETMPFLVSIPGGLLKTILKLSSFSVLRDESTKPPT
jgi:hypothetical protein